MDTLLKLLKLCTDKMKNGVLEARKKRLIRELAKVRTTQEKDVANRRAQENSVAAKEVIKREAFVLAR